MKSYLFILASILSVIAKAQTAIYPSNGTLYDGKLHKIELIMNPDSLSALLDIENRWTDHSYPATFVYDNKDTLKNVGVRIKGNTSRDSEKLSFKIDTDEFLNQSFQGLKTFNLNGNHNDPSMCREQLSANVMRKAANVSSRANSVQLYFNGNLRGIYTNVEPVNKRFLSSRFGENNGNLYKCSYPGNLGWLGSNQQTYKDLVDNSPLHERTYELKTNETADDYTDLVKLINVVNNVSSQNFKKSIDSIFNVDAYLKVLAAEVLIGHWDNYSYNKNNYYLYHHQASGKFIYIPLDMDNTFGVQWGMGNVNNRNVNSWGNSNNGPLTSKILRVPEYKTQYQNYIRQLCDTAFSETRLFALIDSLKTKLTSAVNVDPFFNGTVDTDYGYTVSDWQRSFTEAIDDHATFGLKPYISNRRTSALQQIPSVTGVNTLTGISNEEQMEVEVFPNPATDKLTILSSNYKSITATLLDFSGRTIAERQIESGEQFISTKEFPKGMYILSLNNGNTQKYLKILIE